MDKKLKNVFAYSNPLLLPVFVGYITGRLLMFIFKSGKGFDDSLEEEH